jgi:hypothetical protein
MSNIESYRYDVFISYSQHDEAWARDRLLPKLEGAKLHVCIDVRDFEIGAPRLTEIERAVVQSRKTLLVLTPAYLASEWDEFESLLVQMLDPAARKRRLLPLLLKQCQLPLRIRALNSLDFTKPGIEQPQFERLIKTIKTTGARSGGSSDDVSPQKNEPKQLSRAKVLLLIEGDADQFTQTRQEQFIDDLAQIVGIAAEHIRIVHIGQGSIALTIELPFAAALQLVARSTKHDAALQPLKVIKVELSESLAFSSYFFLEAATRDVNRTALRDISLDVIRAVDHDQEQISRVVVDPLIDRVAQGQIVTSGSDTAFALGGGELLLLVVIPLVVSMLTEMLKKSGAENIIQLQRTQYPQALIFSQAKVAHMVTETGITANEQQIAALTNAINQAASTYFQPHAAEVHAVSNSFVELWRAIVTYFNLEELRNVCFQLSIDYESLGGETKEAKARELVSYCNRHGRISDLLDICRRQRPHAAYFTSSSD